MWSNNLNDGQLSVCKCGELVFLDSVTIYRIPNTEYRIPNTEYHTQS